MSPAERSPSKGPFVNHRGRIAGAFLNRRSRLSLRLQLLAALLCSVAVTCFLFGTTYLLAANSFVFDLIANLNYCAGSLFTLVAIVAALTKRHTLALCATGAAVSASAVTCLHIEMAPRANQSAAQVKVLFCNVQESRTAWHRLRAIIRDRDPDLVGLVEVNPEVLQAIQQDARLKECYPFQIMPQRGFEWTRVVLSRHSFTLVPRAGDVERYKFMYAFSRSVVVSAPQGSFIFIVEHFPSPRNEVSWSLGNQSIQLLGELVHNQLAATGMPILIAGDFNTTPTGYRDWLFREATGLRSDPLGFPPCGTWPSVLPQFVSLPLDRVWGSSQIVFSARQVLENVGSDHRPIMVTFSMQK